MAPPIKATRRKVKHADKIAKLITAHHRESKIKEIDVDLLCEIWGNNWVLGSWRATDEWFIARKIQKNSRKYYFKCDITPEQANQLIEKLDLIGHNVFAKSGWDYRTKSGWKHIYPNY